VALSFCLLHILLCVTLCDTILAGFHDLDAHQLVLEVIYPIFLHRLHYLLVALGAMDVHYLISCYAKIMCNHSLCTGLIKNILPNHGKR
jgi:hypothetical protein